MAEVALHQVGKAFGRQVALDGVSMTVPDGSFVVLLGPTGAGKTTLLRLVSGLEKKAAGDVLIGSTSMRGLTPAQRNVAMVFQQYSLYPHLTVRENMAFPLKSPLLKTPKAEIARKVAEVAEILQISHKLDNKATALSGGETQRVAIGRALVRNPAVYLMDEPLSSLDAKLRADLRVELKSIQANSGATLIYVSHDQIQAMTMAISVYPLTAEDEKALKAETPLSAWPGCHAMTAPALLALPDGLTPIRPVPPSHAPTRAFVTRCCEIMMAMEHDLNALDAKAGDGDTGSTLARAARALLGALDRLPLADHTQLYRAIGQELSQTMGGSSGVLLAIFFTAAGDAASSGLNLRDALRAGLARMQEIGGARPGDRTMIDALHPALDALDQGLDAARRAARKGADFTATRAKAKAGRAAYVSAGNLSGHVDPGAEAVTRLFEALSSPATSET